MCSDSNKREGWKEGKREKSKEKEGEGGREKVGRTRNRTVSLETTAGRKTRRTGSVCALQELFLFLALISIK